MKKNESNTKEGTQKSNIKYLTYRQIKTKKKKKTQRHRSIEEENKNLDKLKNIEKQEEKNRVTTSKCRTKNKTN
jgi:cell shape-determining protein MreC